MENIRLDTKISLSKEQISSEMDGQAVILQIKDGVYYGLNDVGAAIWRFIQKPHTVDEIVVAVLDEFDVDRERCEADVRRILTELAGKNLVVINHEPPA